MQLDQSMSQSCNSRDAYRKYSVESDFESQDDKGSNRFIQETGIEPFCQSQYAILNDESNLKLLQHIHKQSLVYERLCSYYGPQNNNFSNVEEEICKRKEMNGKYNLILYDYSMIPGKNQFNIFYEAFAQGLNKEFINHVKQNLRWRERELINTVKYVLKGLKELHDREIIHGDLRMSNIVLTEQGEVKLADQYCINYQKIDTTSYYKKDIKMLIATHSYFPPESMQILQDNQNIDTSSNNYQNIYTQVITKNGDLWALGIILLEMVLLENVHKQIYDFNNFQIRINLLKQKIKKVRTIYPRKSQVINLINFLLSDNPIQRMEAFDHIKNSYFIRKSVSFKESPKNSSISNNSFSKIGESDINSKISLSQTSLQHSNFISEPMKFDQSLEYIKNDNLNNSQLHDIQFTQSLDNFNCCLHSQTNIQRDSISQNELVFQNEITENIILNKNQIVQNEIIQKNDKIYQSEPIYQSELIYQNKSEQQIQPIYQYEPNYQMEPIYEDNLNYLEQDYENKNTISKNELSEQTQSLNKNCQMYQKEFINDALEQIGDSNIINQVKQVKQIDHLKNTNEFNQVHQYQYSENQDDHLKQSTKSIYQQNTYQTQNLIQNIKNEEPKNQNIYSIEYQKDIIMANTKTNFNEKEQQLQCLSNQQTIIETKISQLEKQKPTKVQDYQCIIEIQNENKQVFIKPNQINNENKANEVQFEIEKIYEEDELQANKQINQQQLSESNTEQKNESEQNDDEESNYSHIYSNISNDQNFYNNEKSNVMNQQKNVFHNIMTSVIEQPIKNNLFESNIEEDKKDSLQEIQQCINDDCLVVYNYDNLLQDSDIDSLSSLNNSQQISYNNQKQKNNYFNTNEKENIQTFSNQQTQQSNDFKNNQKSINPKSQKGYQQQLLSNIFDFQLKNKQKKLDSQFDYSYEYQHPNSQIKKESENKNNQNSQRNQEYILFPNNKQLNHCNIINNKQEQKKQQYQNTQNSIIQDLNISNHSRNNEEEYNQNNNSYPQNQNGIFLLSNYSQKANFNASQKVNVNPIIADIKKYKKGQYITTDQSSAITDYFNQISPIGNSGSRLTTNQSVSIAEWMKESCIQNGGLQINSNRVQYDQQIKIDEKIQKLDELCGQALIKSQRNREKIELITSSIKKKRENIFEQDQQNKSIDMDDSHHNNESAQQIPDLKSYSIIDQLNQINHKVNSQTSNSIQSVSNYGIENDMENNVNIMNIKQSLQLSNINNNNQQLKANNNQQISNNIKTQNQKMNTLLSQFDAQIKQEKEYSQIQNLKLSAHYGSLALNHLVEYIEQSKRKQSYDIQRQELQNNDSEFNTKLLNNLFKNENDIPNYKIHQSQYHHTVQNISNPLQINFKNCQQGMNQQLNPNQMIIKNTINDSPKEQNFKGISLLWNSMSSRDNTYSNKNLAMNKWKSNSNEQEYEIKTPTNYNNDIINKYQTFANATS